MQSSMTGLVADGPKDRRIPILLWLLMAFFWSAPALADGTGMKEQSAAQLAQKKKDDKKDGGIGDALKLLQAGRCGACEILEQQNADKKRIAGCWKDCEKCVVENAKPKKTQPPKTCPRCKKELDAYLGVLNDKALAEAKDKAYKGKCGGKRKPEYLASLNALAAGGLDKLIKRLKGEWEVCHNRLCGIGGKYLEKSPKLKLKPRYESIEPEEKKFQPKPNIKPQF